MARPRKVKRGRGTDFPVDAEKWFEQHQRKHPPRSVTRDDLVRRYQRGSRALLRRRPFRLIQEFISCFRYQRGGTATLATRPDDSLLEILAELFRQWWTGNESFDKTFGLISSGRGRKGIREKHRLDRTAFVARFIYDDLRANGMLKKQALPEVAKALKISEPKANALLFRRRKV